jgi:hypothetical protein
MGIPDPEDLSSSLPGEIPIEVTTRPEDEESPEAKLPVISFKRYNEDYCQVDDGILGPYSRCALQIMKGMGTRVPFYAPNPTYINGSGDYAGLYKTVSDIPDAVVTEVRLDGKIQGKNGKKEKVNEGRLFYYKAEDTVFIIAIRAIHLNTEKGKH